MAADVALVVTLPRDWTAAALGIGTTAGMTVAAVWMLLALRLREPACLRGVGRTVLSGVVCAVLAAAAGLVVCASLPQHGVATSIGVAAAGGLVAVSVFAGAAARLDRATLLLVMRRRADAG